MSLQTLHTRLRGYDGALAIESFSRGLNSYSAIWGNLDSPTGWAGWRDGLLLAS